MTIRTSLKSYNQNIIQLKNYGLTIRDRQTSDKLRRQSLMMMSH